MPLLPNPKHEAMAKGLARGDSADAAYVAAGFKANRHNAAALARQQHILTRVAELQSKAAERAEIDIARTLKELVRIGTADLRQVFDKDGRVRPPKEWSDDLAAAISSVEATTTVRDDKAETVYKVKFWDKNAALDKIAKHLGMFIEKSEVTVTHRFHDLSDAEIYAELVGLLGDARPETASKH